MAGEGGRRSTRGVLRPFFRPRRWKMGGSSFFGREGGRWGVLRSSKEEVSPPPFFRPIFDPFFGAEDRRWKGSSVFDSEDRKLKMGGSSTFVSEERRWGVFDLRLRRSKIEDGVSSNFGSEDRRWGILPSSASKDEDSDVLRIRGVFRRKEDFSKKRVFEEGGSSKKREVLRRRGFFEEGGFFEDRGILRRKRVFEEEGGFEQGGSSKKRGS